MIILLLKKREEYGNTRTTICPGTGGEPYANRIIEESSVVALLRPIARTRYHRANPRSESSHEQYNTLERYARKYEPKEPAVESAPVENGGSGEVFRNKEGESECVNVLSGKTMPCVSARSGAENMMAVPSRSAVVRNLPNGLKIKSITTRGKSHRK